MAVSHVEWTSLKVSQPNVALTVPNGDSSAPVCVPLLLTEALELSLSSCTQNKSQSHTLFILMKDKDQIWA